MAGLSEKKAKMDELKCLAREFRSALEARLSGDPAGEYRLPSKEDVATFCRRYLDSLFPLHHAPEEPESPQASHFEEELEMLLAEQIVCAIRFDCSCRRKKTPANLARAAEELVGKVRTIAEAGAFAGQRSASRIKERSRCHRPGGNPPQLSRCGSHHRAAASA